MLHDDRSTSKLWIGLLLLAAACGSDDGMVQPGIVAGNGSGAAGTTAMAGTGPAGAGGAGIGAPDAGITGRAGSAAVGGSAGRAGSSGMDDDDAGVPLAGSGGGGAGGSAGTPAAGSGGQGGTAGSAAGAGGQGAAGSGGRALKPKCKTSPDQVVVIGDSYINWITHSFPQDLAREAGETWRMYAVGGCSLGSGGLCLIPPQLDQAIMDDPDIVAAVMSGGGNDILIADEVRFPGGGACKDRTDSASVKVCQDIVATAIAAGEKLMQRAADAGIRDVIYLFYPHIPGGGFGGTNPNYLLDYSLPKAKALCDEAETRTGGKLSCHFLDLVPVFEGHDDWFSDDGIHENSLGSAAMAKEVVRIAKEKCVAQPASSGCCEP